MTNQHTEITLSFLVVGHTKFAPDWCFGLMKRLYRRSKVGSLQAITQVTNDSAKCNLAQLVVTEVGDIIVLTYDWHSMFTPHLKNIEGIKKYHHFHFNGQNPGSVSVKVHSDSNDEIKFNLL